MPSRASDLERRVIGKSSGNVCRNSSKGDALRLEKKAQLARGGETVGAVCISKSQARVGRSRNELLDVLIPKSQTRDGYILHSMRPAVNASSNMQGWRVQCNF